MPLMQKLGAASVLFGLAGASPLLDDSSALVQGAHFGIGVGSMPICTEKADQEYQKKLATYMEQTVAFQKKVQAKAKAKADQKQAEVNGNLTLFLQPMLDVMDHVGHYLETECQPTGIKMMKGALQQLFDASMVPESKRIDVNATVTGFLNRWQKELMNQTRSMLSDGFTQLHYKINKIMESYPAGLRTKIYNATFPVKNETQLREYILLKGLPVLGMEVDPVSRWIGDLMADMPEDAEEDELMKWATKTVFPKVMEKLPKQCQQGRLISTLGFGAGDIGSRIAKFIEKCTESVEEQLDLIPETPPKKPERKCQTCLEQYREQVGDMSNANSCASHCSSGLVACVGGVNDKCIQGFAPCFRCNKRKLEALDKCEQTPGKRGATITTLDKMMEVFSTASVEKDSVNSLLDQFLDLAAQSVGLPVPTTPAPAAPVSQKKRMFGKKR